MANASYTSFKDGLLNGDYDLSVATLKVALVRTYTYSITHTNMAQVTAAGGVMNGTPATLANKTVSGGIFDADDATITTTADANTHILIVYQSSAVTGGGDVAAANQLLCWYFDTGTGLPLTPGAGVVTVTWPNTAAKIYKLG
jgi:hypothetical protein